MSIKVAEFPKATDAEIEAQIGILEKLLEEAKRGNFETLFVLALTHDGDTLTRWSGAENLVLLAGHLARLQHVTQRRMDGDT